MKTSGFPAWNAAVLFGLCLVFAWPSSGSCQFDTLDEEDCRFLHEFVGDCFAMGLESRDKRICQDAVDTFVDEVLNQSNPFDEDVQMGTAFLAGICEAACESAVDGEGFPAYKDFEQNICRD